MSNVDTIHVLEDLRKYLNDKGLIEIVIRDKNKRYKVFQKVVIDDLKQDELAEKVQQAVDLLHQKIHEGERALNVLNNISKLNKLSIVLEGANLCATCVGFAIMSAKLDKISAQIADVVALYQENVAINANFEFKKVLSEHSNMLDCRKKQKYYTEDQMRELIDDEYNVLELLIDIFSSGISNSREELLIAILSLAQMLSVSLRYFDEIYYYDNKEKIGNGEYWHLSHNKWMDAFDRLSSTDFIKQIQDYGIFEKALNTIENDCFYIGIYDQVKSLKQDVEDNQEMIAAIDNKELFDIVMNGINQETKEEIAAALEEVGAPVDEFEDIINATVTL